ncbi:acetyl-CoA carboxylase biotin carboxyl carrier protein [Owenweeksia hongkongensis]|uniref:acetyl-CoA carboxylase biotin carboxyl carrier protein n=1 Tax=Owenweeksia hongkongensis TaxID=253245 RepID=UPI003A8DB68B
MDIKEIQNLIKFVARSGAAEVNLETEDFKINIKTDAAYKSENPVPQVYSMPQMAQAPMPQQAAPQAPAPTAGDAPAAPAAEDDDSKYIAIKSPMIGTFYRRPSPDKELFVNVGDDISSGSVVCIIEAMKLFNEIESEVSGKIVKILVDDQTPVEYDQPLFLVDPS